MKIEKLENKLKKKQVIKEKKLNKIYRLIK